MDLVRLGNELTEGIPELKKTFDSISSVLGELTFAARMDHNLTQKQLAEFAKVGVKTIHRIEGGSGGVTDSTYQKVFAALGVSGDEIAEAFKKKPSKFTEKELVEA